MGMIRRALVGSVVLVLAQLTGCASTTASGAVGVQRSQLLLVPSAAFNQKSAQAYATMTKEASSKAALNSDTALTGRVRDIGARLIPHVATFRPDATNWHWEVNVFDSDELNAFCLPGGKIGFYRGLIERLELTDDEIASVMGHEISHALREHSREKASQQTLAAAVVAGLAASAEPRYQRGTAELATLASQLFLHLPFSRHMESEADAMGLELMARGGYDPGAAVEVWRKMGRQSSSRPPEFLSTHPSGATRIADIEALLPRVRPLREQAIAQSGRSVPVAQLAAVRPSDNVPKAAPSLVTGLPATAIAYAPASRLPAPDSRARTYGPDSAQLRTRIVGTGTCSPDPEVHLVARADEGDLYEAECTDRTQMRFSCSFGVCKPVLGATEAWSSSN